MQNRPPQANVLEDDDPDIHVGEEAFAPIDTGRGVSDEDLNPPESDLTPGQEDEEDRRRFSEEDEAFSEEEAEQ